MARARPYPAYPRTAEPSALNESSTGADEGIDDLLGDYRRRLLERFRFQPEPYHQRLRRLDGASLHAPIEPGEWSAHQVIFHVRAADEQAYGPRLMRILRDERPELENYDEVAWMTDHYDPDEAADAILDRWQTARRGWAGILETAPAASWSRSGLHPFYGARTLQWWLERAVAHGEDHRRQLEGE